MRGITTVMADDENKHIPFGTPLEPFEEDDVPKKKPVRVEDQIVTDEKGRRRFHGAFTGGFSAGYFNSVGSLEGWSPAHFKSSRSKRKVQTEKCPEDFMDAEDVGTFGIAPRTIHTTRPFTAPEHEENKRKRPFSELNFGPIPFVGLEDTRLKDLVVPLNSSIGVKLLYKMGWKHGQGIGPRIKRKKKKKIETSENDDNNETNKNESNVKIYGCALPPTSETDSDEEFANFTFAPKDVEIVQYVPKENQQGLGYTGLDKRPVLSSKLRLFDDNPVKINKKTNLGMRGQAFGVGAFENDDDDIYAIEDMSNYNFTETAQAVEKNKSKPKDESSSSSSRIKILEGFELATKPPPVKKHFPLPNLPRNFTPFHKAIPTPVEVEIMPVNKGPHRQINSFERGAALGEKVEPGSVFNFISPHDKARLDSIRLAIEKSRTPKEKHEEKPEEKVKIEEIPTVPPKPIKPGKFKPFAADVKKQTRYEKFLSSDTKESFTNSQPSTMTEWEKVRELEEFQKASLLYRPMAASIASRFVSARALDQDDTPSGLSLPEKIDPDKLDLMKAVEMKMFGRLTRQKVTWHPDKLLCKRFNVPNPYPDSNEVGTKKVEKKGFSIFNFLTMESIQNPSEEPEEPENNEQDEVEEQDEQEEEQEEAKDEKPPMDLFKAIFEESDKESEHESEEQETDDEAPVPDTNKNQPIEQAPIINIPPPDPPVEVEQTQPQTIITPPNPIINTISPISQPDEMFYGPKLPPPTTTTVAIPTESKQHKKKKEKRKHKHKKQKKHKRKHKRMSESNSESESESNDEVNPKEILKRLKLLQKTK